MMTANILVNGESEQGQAGTAERLPPVTAGLVIFALSALCWLPLMLPFVVFGRLCRDARRVAISSQSPFNGWPQARIWAIPAWYPLGLRLKLNWDLAV